MVHPPHPIQALLGWMNEKGVRGRGSVSWSHCGVQALCSKHSYEPHWFYQLILVLLHGANTREITATLRFDSRVWGWKCCCFCCWWGKPPLSTEVRHLFKVCWVLTAALNSYSQVTSQIQKISERNTEKVFIFRVTHLFKHCWTHRSSAAWSVGLELALMSMI